MAHDWKLVRDFEAGKYLDFMMVVSVTTVLLIRFYLALTGYPEIGGKTLHIAHMLPGGLMMLAAIIMLISFLGRSANGIAALLAGVGFGFFIDEVGKFITQDNDYFFKPTVAVMYVIFILLYMAIRSIHNDKTATKEDYLVNALVELGEVAKSDLSQEKKSRALDYLSKCGDSPPIVPEIRKILEQAEVIPDHQLAPVARFAVWLGEKYRNITASPLFSKVLITVFVLQVLAGLAWVVMFVFFKETGENNVLGLPIREFQPRESVHFGFIEKVETLANLLGAVFIGLGIYLLKHSRLRALRMFLRAILLNLLVTQVCVFYQDQWVGLITLAYNLLIYMALQYMIDREESDRRQ